VIDGTDGPGVVVIHDVDFWPVISSLRISTGFVLLHPLPAFFLPVALKLAEIAILAISVVVVVSASGIAGSSAGSCLISSSSGMVISSA
jgi:hypothetical protein